MKKLNIGWIFLALIALSLPSSAVDSIQLSAEELEEQYKQRYAQVNVLIDYHPSVEQYKKIKELYPNSTVLYMPPGEPDYSVVHLNPDADHVGLSKDWRNSGTCAAYADGQPVTAYLE